MEACAIFPIRACAALSSIDPEVTSDEIELRRICRAAVIG